VKIKFKKIDKGEWHKKFAWFPRSVQDSQEKHTYVWMEKYMRRYRCQKWERYSKTEWFRKKLAGDFEETKGTDGVFVSGSGYSSSTITIPAGGGISSSTPTYTFTYDGNTGFASGITIDEDDRQLDLDFGEDDLIKQQTDLRHNQW